MCIGTHGHYVPGMVCGPCVSMTRTYPILYFLFALGDHSVSSLMIGATIDPPLQLVRCIGLEREAHEHGRYSGINMWSRRFVCCCLVNENLCSLDDVWWKTEVIGKLYYIRSADENVGGSVVDIFRKTDVIGKLYNVWSTNETRVVGECLCVFRDSIDFCCELRRQGRRAEDLRIGCIILNCWFVRIYINTVIDSSMTMLLRGRLKYHNRNCQ